MEFTVEYERQKGVRGDFKVLGLSNSKNGLAIYHSGRKD